AAGFQIIGLDIVGLNRKSLFKNLLLPFKLIKSLLDARKIIRSFNAELAVGVGGFASWPLLKTANFMGIPTVIQEQNSYAGLTNKQLGTRAHRICVAYPGMDQFFPAEKIMLTGNPIRKSTVEIIGKRDLGLHSFGLDYNKKTVLITGGSLGSLTLNECIKKGIPQLIQANIQVIWQCGNYYYQSLKEEFDENLPSQIKLMPFLDKMDLAYAAADIIISRAGAGTISELAVIGKPVILIPSPNVADDHQTKNAKALVERSAAILVHDNQAKEELIKQLLLLNQNTAQQQELSNNIKKLAIDDADIVIAKEILTIINKLK
ncbi:MAG: undecaprenyldiphospho-muramoylpentapeptide beta-N-acetylglucosaminyltransferase, partial [Sphingobacterium sp.]